MKGAGWGEGKRRGSGLKTRWGTRCMVVENAKKEIARAFKNNR